MILWYNTLFGPEDPNYGVMRSVGSVSRQRSMSCDSVRCKAKRGLKNTPVSGENRQSDFKKN